MAKSAIGRYGAEQLVQFAIDRALERRLWLRGSARERRAAAELTIRRLAKAALSGETMRFTL
jgi:hypothetical protein